MSEDQHPLAPMLRKLQHDRALSPDDRAAILALPHALKAVEPHAYLVREGDRTTHSCLLREGYVYRHKTVSDGGRQICSIHLRGDMVDLHNSLLEVADHSVQALTTSKVACIPRDAVRRLAAERPSVGAAMWYTTLVDGSIAREWIANIGRRDARTGLAHLLCEFAIRSEAAGVGSHSQWTLPMTQEHIADCLGLTAIHVNRTLRRLDREGLLARAKKSVTVLDWRRLAQVGDFCSAYLHMRADHSRLLQ